MPLRCALFTDESVSWAVCLCARRAGKHMHSVLSMRDGINPNDNRGPEQSQHLPAAVMKVSKMVENS